MLNPELTTQTIPCGTCGGSGLLPDVDNTFEPCPTCGEDGYITIDIPNPAVLAELRRRINAGYALADRLETEAKYAGQRYIAVDLIAERIRRALKPAHTVDDGGYLRPGERRTEQPHRDLAQGQP